MEAFFPIQIVASEEHVLSITWQGRNGLKLPSVSAVIQVIITLPHTTAFLKMRTLLAKMHLTSQVI